MKRRDPQSVTVFTSLKSVTPPYLCGQRRTNGPFVIRRYCKRSHNDASTLYYTSLSATKEPIFSKTLQEFISLRGKWESFDEFRKQNYGVWIINMNANALREWTCTSPSFHKNYYQCKHCLILQIRQKYVNPPVEHPNVPLDQKRMRGRLSEAKRDLPTQ